MDVPDILDQVKAAVQNLEAGTPRNVSRCPQPWAS
jgi:hypothetical protein